ncbi:hypothetical protein [Borrelia venezuelensis]|uniref:hypothetical protein n=1 Tax=Borrelia venezuelensis TaxID=1653839 RepID=UPI001FF10517|nr:hypothetical protein [Borrelia venezuelensis]UPA12734.1 hypothetical protein bvRMA01_001069 [Borrelia venezuelensis]
MNCKLKDKFVDSLDKSYSVLYTNKGTVVNFFLIVLIKKTRGRYTLKKELVASLISVAILSNISETNLSTTVLLIFSISLKYSSYITFF